MGAAFDEGDRAMTTLDRPSQDLLRDAADWRLIGLLLECPSTAWREQVRVLSRDVNDPGLREAASLALDQASEGLYHSTFGPGGPAPPREATHRDTLQLGYLISELQAFYDSFGYRADSREPPDHIAVQAGFVAYLKFKQAFAESCGDKESAAITSDACREFIAEHLASTADPLSHVLAASGVPYLEAAARALSRRAGPAKTRFLVLRDDGEFGCGAAAGESEEQI
jgi:TorA maturation chaperone TorD